MSSICGNYASGLGIVVGVTFTENIPIAAHINPVIQSSLPIGIRGFIEDPDITISLLVELIVYPAAHTTADQRGSLPARQVPIASRM